VFFGLLFQKRDRTMEHIKIILVEDDPILNADICASLEEMGFEVQSFYCADAAIEAINRHDYIAALLTDINLGKGHNGFYIACHARSLYPTLPVVFVSAESTARQAVHGVRGSVLVSKPFHPVQLAEALHSVIRSEAA
jgi:DNA-binding response OmpR family regulator